MVTVTHRSPPHLDRVPSGLNDALEGDDDLEPGARAGAGAGKHMQDQDHELGSIIIIRSKEHYQKTGGRRQEHKQKQVRLPHLDLSRSLGAILHKGLSSSILHMVGWSFVCLIGCGWLVIGW